MKNRDDFEEELDLKYEMEMAQEQKNLRKEEEKHIENFEKDDSIATKAVEKLMEEFDDEELDSFLREESDDVHELYERNTENLEFDDENLESKESESVFFYKTQDENLDSDVEDEEETKYKNHLATMDRNRLRTYFNAAVATLILFLLIVVFLLTLKLNSYEAGVIAAKPTNQIENDQSKRISELTKENAELRSFVDSLKNELQGLIADSGAEKVSDENQVASNEQVQIEEEKVPLAAPTIVEEKKNDTLDADISYVVKKGDTLMKLAKRYYGDPKLYTKIKEANGLKEDEIRIGTKLIIPKQY